MRIFKAYKFRLYPTKEQEILINKNIGSSRYVYNYFLNRKDEYYRESKNNLSLIFKRYETRISRIKEGITLVTRSR